MGIKIPKPIDREYFRKNLEKLIGHTLYEMVEEEIVDVPENYVIASSTDPGALEVVDDSVVVPSTTEVGKSVVIEYIPTIQVGDYVTYTPAQTHKEDVMEEKYAHRMGDDMSDDDMEGLWDVTAEQLASYKSLIKDDKVSTATLWSSDKTNSEISDNIDSLKQYVDQKVAKLGTLSMQLVTTLPSNPQENVLYIYQNGTNNKIYIYDGTQWVDTGVDLSSIDFSNFYTKTEIDTKFTDYSKTNEVVLVSDLKADLQNPSTGEAASTKAVSDAIQDLVSGQIDLSNYVKTSNVVQNLNTTATDTILSTDALKTILNKMSSISTDDTYEPFTP